MCKYCGADISVRLSQNATLVEASLVAFQGSFTSALVWDTEFTTSSVCVKLPQKATLVGASLAGFPGFFSYLPGLRSRSLRLRRFV